MPRFNKGQQTIADWIAAEAANYGMVVDAILGFSVAHEDGGEYLNGDPYERNTDFLITVRARWGGERNDPRGDSFEHTMTYSNDGIADIAGLLNLVMGIGQGIPVR